MHLVDFKIHFSCLYMSIIKHSIKIPYFVNLKNSLFFVGYGASRNPVFQIKCRKSTAKNDNLLFLMTSFVDLFNAKIKLIDFLF